MVGKNRIFVAAGIVVGAMVLALVIFGVLLLTGAIQLGSKKNAVATIKITTPIEVTTKPEPTIPTTEKKEETVIIQATTEAHRATNSDGKGGENIPQGDRAGPGEGSRDNRNHINQVVDKKEIDDAEGSSTPILGRGVEQPAPGSGALPDDDENIRNAHPWGSGYRFNMEVRHLHLSMSSRPPISGGRAAAIGDEKILRDGDRSGLDGKDNRNHINQVVDKKEIDDAEGSSTPILGRGVEQPAPGGIALPDGDENIHHVHVWDPKYRLHTHVKGSQLITSSHPLRVISNVLYIFLKDVRIYSGGTLHYGGINDKNNSYASSSFNNVDFNLSSIEISLSKLRQGQSHIDKIPWRKSFATLVGDAWRLVDGERYALISDTDLLTSERDLNHLQLSPETQELSVGNRNWTLRYNASQGTAELWSTADSTSGVRFESETEVSLMQGNGKLTLTNVTREMTKMAAQVDCSGVTGEKGTALTTNLFEGRVDSFGFRYDPNKRSLTLLDRDSEMMTINVNEKMLKNVHGLWNFRQIRGNKWNSTDGVVFWNGKNQIRLGKLHLEVLRQGLRMWYDGDKFQFSTDWSYNATNGRTKMEGACGHVGGSFQSELIDQTGVDYISVDGNGMKAEVGRHSDRLIGFETNNSARLSLNASTETVKVEISKTILTIPESHRP